MTTSPASLFLHRRLLRLVLLLPLCALLLAACLDPIAGQSSPNPGVLPTAPAPEPENVARWLLSCMRGKTEGGGFKDPSQGRTAMDEALASCRVFLERFPDGEASGRVEALSEESRRWLAHYTQLVSAQKERVAGGQGASLAVRFPGHSAEALELRRKFGHRMVFRTEQARQVVEGFDIDCKGKDGRFLPLSNLILAKLASMSAARAHLEVEADSRGDEVRITDVLLDHSGREMHRTLAFEIDRWGSLKVRNGRTEAVLNACYGGWGEIWVVPTR